MKKFLSITIGIISILFIVSCVSNPIEHSGNPVSYGKSRYNIKFYKQNKTFEIYEEYYRRISHSEKLKEPKLLFIPGYKGRRNIHGKYSLNNNEITFYIIYKSVKYSYYDNNGSYHFGYEIGLDDKKESYSSDPIIVKCKLLEFGDTFNIKFIESNSKEIPMLLKNKKEKSLEIKK